MKTTIMLMLLLLAMTVSAQFACGDAVEYQGKEYNTVQIGTQCWFSENLNVGTMISNKQQQQNNGVIDKWCYGNLETNCDTYGGYYQWNEAMKYGTGDICPTGWHVPTYEEFMVMVDLNGGKALAGAKLKEAGYAHWSRIMLWKPNDNSFYEQPGRGFDWIPTNESGFTWLPAGFVTINRSGNMTKIGYLWTSSLKPSNYFLPQYSDITPYPVQVSVNFNSPTATPATMYTHLGNSIRCIKD